MLFSNVYKTTNIIVVYCKVESIVKSRVGYFAYSLDDVVASTCPVTVKQ